MIGSTPPFPAFDAWEKMSESEQDALIARMEAVRRRNSRIYRMGVGGARGHGQCRALHRVDASIGGAPASVGVLLRENSAVDNDDDASRGDGQAHENDDAATNDLRHGNLLAAMRDSHFEDRPSISVWRGNTVSAEAHAGELRLRRL